MGISAGYDGVLSRKWILELSCECVAMLGRSSVLA